MCPFRWKRILHWGKPFGARRSCFILYTIWHFYLQEKVCMKLSRTNCGLQEIHRNGTSAVQLVTNHPSLFFYLLQSH